MKRTIVTSGSIPKKLKFICKPVTIVHRFWDWRSQGKENETLSVKPTFVSDASNAKTIKTGIRWAGTSSYNFVERMHIPHEPELIDYDNVPISGIRIFSLDIRSEGGRAYKVILPGNFYVDLREDVLLDTILHAGILPGGILGGEYIFARVASQMKLVRVNSELHHSLIAATATSKLCKLANDQLVPGRVYESKSGKRAVFLGWVASKAISCKEDRYNYDKNERWLVGNTVSHKKASLWWESFLLSSKYSHVFEKKEVEQAWNDDSAPKLGSLMRNFTIKKEHAMVSEVPELSEFVASFMPKQDDFISYVQNAASTALALTLDAAEKAKNLPVMKNRYHMTNEQFEADNRRRNILYLGRVYRFYIAGLVNMAQVGNALPNDPSYVNFDWPSIDGKPQPLINIEV